MDEYSQVYSRCPHTWLLSPAKQSIGGVLYSQLDIGVIKLKSAAADLVATCWMYMIHYRIIQVALVWFNRVPLVPPGEIPARRRSAKGNVETLDFSDNFSYSVTGEDG